MKFYGLKQCSTTKKGQALFNDDSIDIIDIREHPPSKEEITLAYEKYDKLGQFLNSSGGLYREMNMKDKVKDMTKKDLVNLLSENGMLIKRPFIVDVESGKVTSGYKEDDIKETWL